jgi:hypothetical protein
MIEQLRTEIRDLERTIESKKDKLKKLMEDALFENNKVIGFAEMQDQFSGITDIELIDDNETAIKAFQDKYLDNFMYGYKVHVFRVSDVEQLKEDFKHLTSMLAGGYYGQDSLYEWMEENNDKLIADNEC